MSAIPPGLAAAEAGPDPRCARHPRRPGLERCERCGDWLCEVCSGQSCEAEDCPRVDAAGSSWALPVPWELGSRLGWGRAFVHTIGRLIINPARFFRALPWTGGLWLPLLFAACCFAIGAGVVVTAVAWADLPGSLPALLLLLAALPFLGLYRAVGTALLLWIGLGVLEGGSRSFRTVARVTAYTMGADLLLPFAGIGVYLATLLQVVGLRRALGVAWWRAVLVACLPLALFHLVVLGGLALYLAISGQRF